MDMLWSCSEYSDFSFLWKNLFLNLLQNLKHAVRASQDLFSQITKYLKPEDIDDLIQPMLRLYEYNIPGLVKVC